MVLGIILMGVSNNILNLVLLKNMVLSPNSRSYPMWKDLPLPLTNKIYLFNVTNADDVMKNGSKPILKEVHMYWWL